MYLYHCIVEYFLILGTPFPNWLQIHINRGAIKPWTGPFLYNAKKQKTMQLTAIVGYCGTSRINHSGLRHVNGYHLNRLWFIPYIVPTLRTMGGV